MLMWAVGWAGRRHESGCIPREGRCVWAGYDQLQANYPDLTPWPNGVTISLPGRRV